MLDNVADPVLELSTVDVLRGASDLKDRVLLAISSGTPAVADLAYAVKVRVKEDFKIVEKVQGKRLANSTYDPRNLRDIVGLRIMTLYRLDALAIIPALFAAIKADTTETGPFDASSIEEIIIYSTNPTGDPQNLASRLLSLFDDLGYRRLAKIDETPSNYTSIHIVLHGRGKYRDAYRRVPIEIQIRTAFEDVWGEIDHSLKYKRLRTPDADGMKQQERDQLENCLAHLNVMKTMIDGIAQYADQIKLQLNLIDGDGLRYSVSKSAEHPLVRLEKLDDLPPSILSAIETAVNAGAPMLEAGPTVSADERLPPLRASMEALEGIAQDLTATVELKDRTRRETSYVIQMQLALLLFQIGNLEESGIRSLKRSAEIYSDLERTFPKRPVVRYRYARVLDALGARNAAIEKLRSVVQALNKPREQTPTRHWLRAAAPRLLGVLLWEEAEALKRDAPSSGVSATRIRDLLIEAFRVTRIAYDTSIKDGEGGDDAMSERQKAANNLLYYALAYLDAGGALGDTSGIDEGAIVRYLADLDGGDPKNLTDFRFLDTARIAYSHIGDVKKERAAAEQLGTTLQTLETKEAVDADTLARMSDGVAESLRKTIPRKRKNTSVGA